MTDNKFTDKEIKKALECCVPDNDESCLNCPFDKYSMPECAERLSKESIALINRQQAEIENADFTIEQLTKGNLQLQAEIERLKVKQEKCFYCTEQANKKISELKAKAIKEFWSKLKIHSRKMQSSDFSGEFWDKAVLVEDGDNLEKEMVGE